MSKVQEFIDQWRTLSEEDKKEVVEQLSALNESGDLEEELSNAHQSENDFGNQYKTNHTIACADLLNLNDKLSEKIKDAAPNLIFTSPPYNANIEYDQYQDNLPIDKYVEFLDKSAQVMDSILSDGGRVAINVRDVAVATGSRLPILVPLYEIFVGKLKYKYRGVHIWYKGREESSFAWGSYCKSSNPAIIDLFEYVYVFQKPGDHTSGNDNLNKSEFIESVLGIWKIRPVKKIFSKNGKTKNVINHPCPFPIELAKRVIKLYSFVGDTVIDPFGGVMTTSIAAAGCGRNSFSMDLSESYAKSGFNRFCEHHKDLLLTKCANIDFWQKK